MGRSLGPLSFVLIFSVLGVSKLTFAAALESFCHSLAHVEKNKPSQDTYIQGQDIDDVLPIASVTKIVTSWWALSAKGKDYRFTTLVHVAENEDHSFNIHLQGARDPFFGKETLHFLISELNRNNITKIKKLTFDENFKFFWNVTSGKIATGEYTLDAPRPRLVLALLKNNPDLKKVYQLMTALIQKQSN